MPTAPGANEGETGDVGFAPVENPQIVVAVFVEFGLHGYTAARLASRIMERYLKRPLLQGSQTEGG